MYADLPAAEKIKQPTIEQPPPLDATNSPSANLYIAPGGAAKVLPVEQYPVSSLPFILSYLVSPSTSSLSSPASPILTSSNSPIPFHTPIIFFGSPLHSCSHDSTESTIGYNLRHSNMAPKRKDGTSSKPTSANAAAVEKAADPVSAPSGEDEASAPKKGRFVKQDPGMTAKQFEESAKSMAIAFGEGAEFGIITAEPSTFSTGSYGWKANSKIRVKVNVDGEEKEVQVVVGLNMTVSGSKPDAKKPAVSNGKPRGRPRKNPVTEE
ncbi:hypothetical protein PGTUg99_027878 [Puccinia graminis f. sp. tritici]|nr:hypothetical protein PGTUg99_027878 [Puccinia graminis f. sp. tritici]